MRHKPVVEIISHCYAKELHHFAACLVYQTSSLVLDRPRLCDVCLTMCVCNEDERTMQVVEWAKRKLVEFGHTYVVCHLSQTEIGRRCIGRNEAAGFSKADIVWFADVDQVYRDGILDRLVSMHWPDAAVMVYPREIRIHKDHATGDKRTSAVDLNHLRVVDIDPAEFVVKRYRKAIGGVQIVRGDFARQYGYLDGNDRWQQTTNKPFGDFRDDIAYRRFCLQYGNIVGVDLPGMYRIRHTAVSYK